MSLTEGMRVQESASTPSLPKNSAFASWQGSEGGPGEGKAVGGTSEQELRGTEGKWVQGQKRRGGGTDMQS